MPSTPEIIAQSLWPGAAVERSIFGSGDPDEIWRRVRETWPEVVDCFAFEVSVGALLGVTLADRSRAALKAHRDHREERLRAVQRVQRALHTAGFPCPGPLGVRGRFTLEEWIDTGVYRDGHEPAVRGVVAAYLAELHRLTQPLGPLDGLAHRPPDPGRLWPRPHSVLFDFEATATGAEWIDEIAARACRARDVAVGPLAVGHGDWTVKHFRFDGLSPVVIYDWDSLDADFETVLVGASSATFTFTEQLDVDRVPSVEEAQAFVRDYEDARGQAFSAGERHAVAGAAVYTLAYAARCAHAVGELDREATRLDEYAAALL